LAGGRRVAADFEDWHSEDLLPDDRRLRPLGMLRQVEQALLRGAAYVSTTSEAMAAALWARHGGVRPEVITNAFPLQADPRRGPPGAPAALLWFSQTVGPGRGLESFLEAWARSAVPSRLTLLGELRPGYAERLSRRLPARLGARMEFLPFAPPASLPSAIARHDVGLALEDPSIASRNLTITNKILQYLNAGLAIAASDTAGQREVLARRPEAGVILPLHDPARAAADLDRMLGDPHALALRQSAARKLAEERYCWEREAARLLGLVERALNQGRH
jgi:glycosyltransferase involved in cell wall biosynthesis